MTGFQDLIDRFTEEGGVTITFEAFHEVTRAKCMLEGKPLPAVIVPGSRYGRCKF